MKYSKTKIMKATFMFLAIMFFFTTISNKVDYMMTPEVSTIQTARSALQININTNATVINGFISFNINMEKENLLQVGDLVQAEFENKKYKVDASIVEKKFNPDYQTMEYKCMISEEETNIYEGQMCQVVFNYYLGTFDMVLPKECVIYEDEKAVVYYVETLNTVTGQKYIAKKEEVSVIEEDDFNVAVSGSINERQDIIRYFSKAIDTGSKVRYGI